MTAEDMPESYWITLKDPDESDGITSAVVGLDGVSQIRDERETVEPLYTSSTRLKYGSWARPAFLVLAALLLVANTIRLAAFARRKEIGIMRLVGASTLYIALPFLLEALVTAVIGVALAAGALGGVHVVRRGATDRRDAVVPAVDRAGRLHRSRVVVIAILGPLLTLVPTLLLTRKYLKV